MDCIMEPIFIKSKWDRDHMGNSSGKKSVRRKYDLKALNNFFFVLYAQKIGGKRCSWDSTFEWNPNEKFFSHLWFNHFSFLFLSVSKKFGRNLFLIKGFLSNDFKTDFLLRIESAKYAVFVSFKNTQINKYVFNVIMALFCGYM